MGTCSLDNSAKTLGAPSKPPVVRKPGLSDTGSLELFRSGFLRRSSTGRNAQ